MTDVSQYKQSDSQTVRSDFAYVDFGVSAAVQKNVAMAGVVLNASGALVDFATSALQTTANGLLTTIDGDTGTIATHAATLAGAVSGTEMQVDIVSGSVTVTGVSTLTEQQSQTTLLGTIDTDTGAIATSAASIDTKTPSLGQALAAASVPVVLTAAQLTTLTPPAAITGFATESTLSSLNGKVTAVNTGAVVVSSSALPSGASTAAKQPALGTAGTASSDVLTVQGIASMTALKVDGSAVTQPVSGTFWQATQPISGTVDLGATDNAVLDAIAASVAAIDAGQLADGHNVTVDNASIAVTGTFWQATQPVSGTVAVTGVSTLAEQQSQTTHLATIAGDTTAIETAVQLIDDSVVAVDAVGTSAKVLMQGAIRDDALSALTPVEGDAVNLRTDANGALWVNPGTVTVASHAVTNGGTFVVQENGAALTALQLIDDAIVTNGGAAGKYVGLAGWDDGSQTMKRLTVDPNFNDGLVVTIAGAQNTISVSASGSQLDLSMTGVAPYIVGGRASAAAPTDVSADNDAQAFWLLRNGSQVCNLAVGGTLVTGSAGLPVAQQGTWNVGTVTTVTTCSTVTTVSTLTGGGVAHDGADSGNPVKVGARAAATLSDDTMVANADRTDAVSDLDGALIVRPGFPLGDVITERVTNTDGSSTAFTNFGATASTRNYVTAISVYNSSATAGTIDFRDGTAGSVLWTVPIPATGGAVIANGGSPLFYTTANTALAFDVSAALSTVTISITGFKSKARA